MVGSTEKPLISATGRSRPVPHDWSGCARTTSAVGGVCRRRARDTIEQRRLCLRKAHRPVANRDLCIPRTLSEVSWITLLLCATRSCATIGPLRRCCVATRWWTLTRYLGLQALPRCDRLPGRAVAAKWRRRPLQATRVSVLASSAWFWPPAPLVRRKALDGVARALPKFFLDFSALGTYPSRQAGPPSVSLRRSRPSAERALARARNACWPTDSSLCA